MILSRRGSRRVAAGLCALILAAALVAFPVRARAMSSVALASVGGATVIAATLAACGIYPYASAGEDSFGEWGARALTDLLEQYNQAHVESALRMEQVRGYVVGKTVAIASETWEKLRSFVSWMRQTYSLADNRAALELGTFDTISALPVSDITSKDTFYATSLHLPNENKTVAQGGNPNYAYTAFGATHNNVFIACLDEPVTFDSGDCLPFYVAFGRVSGVYLLNGLCSASGPFQVAQRQELAYWYSDNIHPDDSAFWAMRRGYVRADRRAELLQAGVLIFSTAQSMYDYFDSCLRGTYRPTLSGITADTTTVSELPALPEDAEWGGLSVSPGTVTGVADAGIGVSAGTETGTGNPALVDNPVTVMTPQAVERIIQQGVEERQRPVVTPVDVQVATGTDIDSETGVVTQNPVVIELPESVVIENAVEIAPPKIDNNPESWEIPDLNTVFPFSIPWDIFNIYSALNAEPVRPSFSASLYIPLVNVDVPFSIGIPDSISEQVDAFAAFFRKLLLVFLCVATLFFIYERMDL